VSDAELHVITGAFGFTGKRIARRLLGAGIRVRTLTGHPDAAPPDSLIAVAPLQFDDPERLAEDLRGARVLYNTYWVRFAHGRTTYETATENSLTLIRAAEQAGVERIVHVSITNPDERSTLGYFRGKAIIERAITESTLSHAILRPAVLFGDEGILINNIAWLLRRFPLFAVPGSGEYRLQPIFVEDLADLAVEHGATSENTTLDAIGPETFTFNQLVRTIRQVTGSRARIVHLPPRVALAASRLLGFAVRDVMLTDDEVKGLLADKLVTTSRPTGKTKLSDWLAEHRDHIGKRYQSELKRHYRPAH
jgi:NADH dehydrogenase